MPTHALEGLAQCLIAALVVDKLLDLRGRELGVAENREIGCEGAEDAVAAQKNDATVVGGDCADELVGVGFVLCVEEELLVSIGGEVARWRKGEGNEGLTTGWAITVMARRPSR